MRCALATGLGALACASGAQPGSPPSPEQVSIQRIDKAILEIRDQYVDVLDEEPLARRCVEGMERWLAGRSVRVAPGEAPRGRPIERAVDLVKRVAGQLSSGDFDQLSDACIERVVENLDKHTAYMKRDEFRELQVGSGNLGGMGLEYRLKDGYTEIVSTIDNTPASRADLKRGDLITAIDGVSTKGLPLTEVVKLSRGKPGSTVVLEISRPGTAGTLRRELTRQIIRVETVRRAMLQDRVLYLRISQFSHSTYERFIAALREESAKLPEGLAGVILDLRNNSGGLLDSCVGVATVFLPDNKLTVVELRGRTDQNNRKLLARPEDYSWRPRDQMLGSLPAAVRGVPLVLLVNRNTAACPEIIAAAMQDHQRARVIGEKTFGHGTVQTIVPLPGNSALKMTTARYYRPNGGAMELNPVTPDVALEQPIDLIEWGSATDAALPVARKLLLGR